MHIFSTVVNTIIHYNAFSTSRVTRKSNMAAKLAPDIANRRNGKYIKSANFINIEDKGTILVSRCMFLTMPDPITQSNCVSDFQVTSKSNMATNMAANMTTMHNRFTCEKKSNVHFYDDKLIILLST